MTPQEYRSSSDYRIWKEKVLERDRYTCQDCRSVGGPLDAHHIVPFAEDVNKRFDPDNGIALCPLCHGRRHGHPNGFIRRKVREIPEHIKIEKERAINIRKEREHKCRKNMAKKAQDTTSVPIYTTVYQRLKEIGVTKRMTPKEIINYALRDWLEVHEAKTDFMSSELFRRESRRILDDLASFY